MKNLIASKDNSIKPNGTIGIQKCGINFWQKTGFLRHCNRLGFRAVITLINKKFSPSHINNYDDSSYIYFGDDDKTALFLKLEKEAGSKHYFIYGECHTVYGDPDFHVFILQVVSYIGKQIGCKFFVDDATGYLEHRSMDLLKEYIENFEIPKFESPDLLRMAAIAEQNDKKARSIYETYHYNETIKLRLPKKEIEVPIWVEHRECEVGAEVTVRIEYSGEEYVGKGTELEWTDAFADLQKKLPVGGQIKSCLTCRYGTLCPYGQIPNYVLCSRSQNIKNKDDVIEWVGRTGQDIERTAFQSCKNFKPANEKYYTYNDFLHFLRKP